MSAAKPSFELPATHPPRERTQGHSPPRRRSSPHRHLRLVRAPVGSVEADAAAFARARHIHPDDVLLVELVLEVAREHLASPPQVDADLAAHSTPPLRHPWGQLRVHDFTEAWSRCLALPAALREALLLTLVSFYRWLAETGALPDPEARRIAWQLLGGASGSG